MEWAYTFDVHLNALFPFLVILHGVQLLLFGGKELLCCKTTYNYFFVNVVLDQPYFLSLFLSNSLWLAAFFYYIYITFLGYSSKSCVLLYFSFNTFILIIFRSPWHAANCIDSLCSNTYCLCLLVIINILLELCYSIETFLSNETMKYHEILYKLLNTGKYDEILLNTT